MRLRSAIRYLSLACFSVSALAGAYNPGFRPKPATEYRNAQKTEGLVLAAEAFSSEAQTKLAFGKVNPNEYGVVPVLLLLANQSGNSLRLERMRVSYITAGRQTVDSIPAAEVQYVNAPNRPRVARSPIPGLGRNKKNPLSDEVIQGRAFAAKILPPGDAAHGFVYFNVGHRPGAILYITGIEEASTGKELFFVEIPLDAGDDTRR